MSIDCWLVISRLVLVSSLLMGCGSYQKAKRILSRRKFEWARHTMQPDVRLSRDTVPRTGHVLSYTRLKIKPYVGSHNRIYTQLNLRVRNMADLPLRHPVSVAGSALAISGSVARGWPQELSDFAGTVTRLSVDTLNPVLRLSLRYTTRKDRRALRRQLLFQHDTAYFQSKK